MTGSTLLPPAPAPSGERGSVRDVTGRLRRRRRTSWRARLLRVLVLLVVLAVLATVGWLVGFSSVLASRTVVVTGTSQLSPETVVAAAQVPLGEPMVRLDLPAIEQRVTALPPVASVRVERQWPHTLRIAVTERTAAFVVQSGAQYVLVDGTGVPFAVVANQPRGLLTAAADSGNAALMRSLATVADSMPPALRKRVTSVRAGSLDTISLRLGTSATVMWGSAEQSDLKAQVLTALLGQKKIARQTKVYDVSAPADPTTR